MSIGGLPVDIAILDILQLLSNRLERIEQNTNYALDRLDVIAAQLENALIRMDLDDPDTTRDEILLPDYTIISDPMPPSEIT
jgi:hypothetical protein